MKVKHYIILLLFSSIHINGQAKFSKEHVLNDLSYLKKALIEAQYNIYESVSEDTFERGYQQIKNKITQDSLSLLEATNLLQQLPALVNNGHTSINFPGSEYMNYASSGEATIFPLEIAFEQEKPLVRKNWSKNKNINCGDEVISINGTSINEILDKIYRQVSGERLLMKNTKIEMYSFPRYYWQVFGKVDTFKVELKQNEKKITYKLDAIRLIEDYESKRSEILNSTMSLKFYDNIAYLNPGSFGGDLDTFKSFIDTSFTKIKSKHCKTLLIDLRNNSGGDNDYSDYMLSYVANKPFTWNSSFKLRTSALLKESGKNSKHKYSDYWKSIFSHENGERYEFNFEKMQPQPREKRFTGKVYAMVNRQSHSQATVTAAQIQDYNFGTVVGEETAEYPSLIASVFYFNLPNTGIQVQMSKGKMIRVNGSTKQEGVIPDIFIKDYLLDEDDEILKGLLKRIKQ